MLRIGQFTDTFIPIADGVGRVALAYSNTLCKMGHQVTVVTPMYDTGYRGGYPFELVEFMGMRVPGNHQYQTGEAPLDAHYRKRMRQIHLDIVHTHSPFMAGTEALRLAAQRNIPLVGTFHSKYYDDFLKATRSKNLAKAGVKFVVKFYERCDEVWAVGENTADVLRSYGYHGDIQVMPNGVDIHPANIENARLAAHKFDIEEDENVLLFVGQLNWKKNILKVLEACAILRQRGEKYRLIMAGQGPDHESIEKKIHELNLVGTVSLVGHLTDNQLLDGLYQRAGIFVFPSIYDNAPMVVREAAAMGTPAILARGSSAAEIIQEDQNGFLCENDSEDLANAIDRIFSDKEKLRLAGERARETIPVSWDEILKKAVERYQNLVDLNAQGKLRKKSVRIV